jgi:hypothetical protein
LIRQPNDDTVDVSFPIYNRQTKSVMKPGSYFIPVMKSPGCVMIVRDEGTNEQVIVGIIMNVLRVWPILLIACLLMTIFGIIIWLADQFENPDEFTVGNAIYGPLIGFYWGFVTMTTVGYGDKSPRSVFGRLVSVVWLLTGLVLNQMVIGHICNALAAGNEPEELKLYNAKVAAIEQSLEYSVAVSKSASVSNGFHN